MIHQAADPGSLPRRRAPDWRGRIAAALAAAIVTVATAHAEVRVTGDAGVVQVDASQSNVGEVLAALQSAFRLRVKTGMALDKAVNGTFTGSLAQVLARMLQGYNYVMRRQQAEIDVIVIASPADRAAAVVRPQVPNNPAMSLSDAVRLRSR